MAMTRRKAAHTPGPWRLFNSNGVLCVKSSDPDSKNEVVHWSGFDGSHYPKATVANARLIAAAPDLLKALKTLLRFCDAGSSQETDWERAVAAARDTLRRVRNTAEQLKDDGK